VAIFLCRIVALVAICLQITVIDTKSAKIADGRTIGFRIEVAHPARARGALKGAFALILRWSFWIKLRFDAARMPKIKTNTLDWDVMGGAFLGGAPAFVINLGGGDVAVT
jgi:hypothetical protein